MTGPPAPHARPGLDQTSTRLIDSDFRYAAGFSGSNTLPSKKVSLPLAHDGGEFLLVFRLVGPLLGLHDGHQDRPGGLGIFVDPRRAHAERLLRMLVPYLAGVDRGVTDALVDELQIPGFADTEGI